MTSREYLQTLFHECMPLFVALGDEARLRILEIICEENTNHKNGKSVNEITEEIDLSRPAVSHHLKILKDAGIVGVRPEGTSNYYYLTPQEGVRKIMEFGFRLEEYID